MRYIICTIVFLCLYISLVYSSGDTLSTIYETLADSSYNGHQKRSAELSTIYGTVIDSRSKASNPYVLHDVTVKLITSKDTIAVSTSWKGVFIFRKVPTEKVILSLSKLGYISIENSYELSQGKNAIFVTLEKEFEELESSRVTSQVPLTKKD